MARLKAAERERRAAITDLIALGAVRTRNLVGDLGEQIAADYYGVRLEPTSTPGYDLVNRDGLRVQVRTLRSTPENKRTSIGMLRQPFDLVFVLRLDEDYQPTEALEASRETMAEIFGTRGPSWNGRLVRHPRVRRVTAQELLFSAGHRETAAK